MENHYFRQDLDAWLLSVAAGYGARVKQQTRISDVGFDDNGATVIATDGSAWRARFVVDASGFRSPLAQKFDLRETPSRLRHHSRSIFTHMIDVPPYEELFPPGTFKTFNTFSSGTMHHLFKGGWLWVIPFNNHPRATNPLVSVGLQLDPRMYPKDQSLTPEEEFWQFIERYPDIIRQFKNARAAREWVSTDRLQYSPKQTIGYRYCLTSHAAGFIDPLFSRGMSNTFEIINALSWRLLQALRDDDFSVERFEPVQDLEQRQLDFNDNLVANAYTSFSDYALWNAWFRIWVLSQGMSTLRITYTYAKLCQDRDAAAELATLERIAPDGALPEYDVLRSVYAEVSAKMRAVATGSSEASTAAKEIMDLLARNAGPLSMGFDAANPDYRYFGFKYADLRRAMRWAKNDVPPEVGKIAYEETPFLIRNRFSMKEFNPVEELRAAIAGRRHIGRRLRVPEPR
jgi:FADH2 O2-dependent halogenase